MRGSVGCLNVKTVTGFTVGIRLDWQIEADRVHERSGEDPNSRRRRYLRNLQIVFFAVGVLIGVGALTALVAWRLNTVDSALKQSLTEAVQAEVTALRIGDYASFIGLQRSASPEWLRYQSGRYNRYQELKAASQIDLVGRVVDATVDGQRGRAVVEEQREGQRHLVVWFYWRYTDGWRHVPSDYTFWGNASEIKTDVLTVQYQALDAPLAQEIATRVGRWWQEGCVALGCRETPRLTVRLVPDPFAEMAWNLSNLPDGLSLTVPSPLASEDGATMEAIFPAALEDQIAAQIAARQFGMATQELTPTPTADATWLRQAIVDWLAATFTGRGDVRLNGFIQSIHDNYGSSAVGTVARALAANSDISMVSAALNQPLPTLLVDWRAFFQWRLNVEKTLLTENRMDEFSALWDSSQATAQNALYVRLQNPLQQTPQVQVAAISAGADGVPTALVQATLDNQTVLVSFRFVSGTWKRAA
jgi:hypothetical protein